MFVKDLLKTLYKEVEEIVVYQLSRTVHDKQHHLCLISAKDKVITASVKELGYFSRHEMMQPSIDLIADIQDQIGQHILMRFGLPKEGQNPRKILFVILPRVFNELGFVSTGKMIKHCKADRRVGSVVIVEFNIIGK